MSKKHELIGIKTTAQILNLSEARARQLADSGVLPALRTDQGFRLFYRENVERLAAERALKQYKRASLAEKGSNHG